MQALKQRAAANNRSAEAEHRDILEHALRRTKRLLLSQALLKIPSVGQNDAFKRQSDHEPRRDVLH